MRCAWQIGLGWYAAPPDLEHFFSFAVQRLRFVLGRDGLGALFISAADRQISACHPFACLRIGRVERDAVVSTGAI